MQDILAQPVMPPNQMMGGATPCANQFYPGANIARGGASQSPSATDVVGGYDQSINQYTGEPVRMARGGVAAFDNNSEMSAIRALRRAYPHRADAERDAMVKGSPAQQMGVTSADSPILTYAFGPKQELSGRGDGMSDDIPAMIGGQKQAKLSDGEFVIPADVVSGLGTALPKQDQIICMECWIGFVRQELVQRSKVNKLRLVGLCQHESIVCSKGTN